MSLTFHINRSIRMTAIAGLVMALSLTAGALAQKSQGQGKQAAHQNPYTLSTCVVTGEKIGSMGDAIIKEYHGREVRFCCKGCIKKFEKDQKSYIEKVDAMIVEQQLASYPVNTCAVSGGELGGMGDAINYIYGNRLVRFCCKGCIGKFEKEPAKFMKKIDAAIVKKQLADYPLDTCAVLGGPLGGMGEPINLVLGGRLVRLCCKGCVAKAIKDPLAVFAKIDGPHAEGGKGHDQHGGQNKDKGHGHDHGG